MSSDGDSTTFSQRSVGEYSNLAFDEGPNSFAESDDESEPAAKKVRGNVNVVNENVVSVLDKCKITDRNAVLIIAAVAQSLGHDLKSLVINRSSIKRYRENLRAAKAANIKTTFQSIELDAAVIHWDGKMLSNLLERKLVDRLPIILTNGKTEKLLGIPELKTGTGLDQANAIQDVLEDWGLSECIKALCCDTTNSNLCRINGAATLLEKILEKDILFIPCRHHIFEIILKAVFEAKMPFVTSGPNVLIFKKFQEFWPKIDTTKFESGIEDEKIKDILIPRCNEIRVFVEKTLQTAQPRDDYKEFLILTLIFLGILPPCGVKFRIPGAFHHARWMAKAIYSLKIYLFRKQFKMTAKKLDALRDVCVFIVTTYVQAWFEAPLASKAAENDLNFLKKMYRYREIDSEISQVTLQKLKTIYGT